MTHEEYTKIDIDKAYEFIQTGAWNKDEKEFMIAIVKYGIKWEIA